MADSKGFLIIERILRDREGVWKQISDGHDLRSLSGQMLGGSALAFAGYGAVLGASSGWLQALSSAVKLPLLFFVTLAICLPALYLFNLVFGAKLSISQALALVSAGITVIAMLSVAFAPISLFFLVTAPHYNFFKLLNVAILALTGFVGLRFLVGGMRALNLLNAEREKAATAETTAAEPAEQSTPASAPAASEEAETTPAPVAPVAPVHGHPYYAPYQPVAKPANMGLLYVWVVVFGFVGTQLAWTLRPFVGSPDERFEIFRSIDGNFYVDVVKTLGRLFS